MHIFFALYFFVKIIGNIEKKIFEQNFIEIYSVYFSYIMKKNIMQVVERFYSEISQYVFIIKTTKKLVR